MYKRCVKRLIDVIASIILIILTSPILFIVFVLVRIKLGAPVIFKQERPGKNSRIFTVYKFRSMTNQYDKNGDLLSDEMRLTDFGKFLRKSSLDELPELFNILKGDMSFIGPRPLLVRYLDRYNKEQARRHEIRPGLTGWAQVNGRNSISWEDKFRLDVWYVDHCNLWLDTKIFVLTIIKVLKRDGINSLNHATMEEFRGSEKKI